MLVILSKLKRRLSESSSFRKYLFYVLGEIALVVLGILIALQINNWNEERTAKKNENYLIEILTKELESAHRYVDNRISRLQNLIDADGNAIFKYTGSQNEEVEIDSLSRYIMGLFYIGGFAPPTVKFEQVINGEGMDLIQSDSLQLLLIRYDNQLKLAFNHDVDLRNVSELQNFWNKHMVAHTIVQQSGHNWFDLFDQSDPSRFQIDIRSVLNKVEFENIIVNRMMLLHSTRKRLSNMLRHIERILEYIERHYGSS